MGIKKGAYRSCYNNQSVDNVRFVEQDHCVSSPEKYFEKFLSLFKRLKFCVLG